MNNGHREGGFVSRVIDEKKPLSFSLGFLLAMLGAVATAVGLYTKLQSDNDFLKVEVAELKTRSAAQTAELSEMKMEFRLFLQKYDQDMNRYIRDRRETTVR